jgi:hypothetical protein
VIPLALVGLALVALSAFYGFHLDASPEQVRVESPWERP